jgi:alpha-L-glutamate ligase-like protein
MLGMNQRNVDYIGRYNDRSMFPLVDNKLKTKQIAAEFDIKTPALLQVLEYQYQISHFRELVESLDGFVIKPAKGSGGKGITVITHRDGDLFFKPSGAAVELATLEIHLSNILAGLYSLGGSPDVAIVERLIQPCSLLSKYSHQGVPDIRILVFHGYPVMAMLRLSTVASDGKANLHQGAVGVGINIATGHSVHAVQFDLPVTHHQDTGMPLDGILLNDWPEMLRMAASCYEASGLGYLGVDLVLDEQDGPMLLELNARPGLAIQMANGQGLLPRLALIEQMNHKKYRSPEQRAAFVMQAFG